jgi:sulfhydrogenase subunit beta (sulfur reductase)
MMKKLNKEYLKALFEKLAETHRIIGPKIEHEVIVLGDICIHDIPAGVEDSHGKGSYHLIRGARRELFSFSVGPFSFKNFLHPPEQELFAFRKSGKAIHITVPDREEKPLAFLDMRACDISALMLFDRIFLEGASRDASFEVMRKDAFIVGLNCLYPGDNCFCLSMGTGPEVKEGFDLAITELDTSLLLEAGSVKGRELLSKLPLEDPTGDDKNEQAAKIKQCKQSMKKSVTSGDHRSSIYRNLDHPHWKKIAERDLECGNCTQVCPTCFCNSSYDVVHLSGISKTLSEISGKKMRKWDSCFSGNFSHVHGGNFRPSRYARYRQWLCHKMAYTVEQFGLPGCVGCGRCITWCPAGIDITEELKEVENVR